MRYQALGVSLLIGLLGMGVASGEPIEPVTGVANVRLETTETLTDVLPRVETIWRAMGAWEDTLLTQVLVYAMRLDAQAYIGLTRHDPSHTMRIPDESMPLYVYCVSVDDTGDKEAAQADAQIRCADFLVRFHDANP